MEWVVTAISHGYRKRVWLSIAYWSAFAYRSAIAYRGSAYGLKAISDWLIKNLKKKLSYLFTSIDSHSTALNYQLIQRQTWFNEAPDRVRNPKIAIHSNAVMSLVFSEAKVIPRVWSHKPFRNSENQSFSIKKYKSIVILQTKPSSKFEEIFFIRKSNLVVKASEDVESKTDCKFKSSNGFFNRNGCKGLGCPKMQQNLKSHAPQA